MCPLPSYFTLTQKATVAELILQCLQMVEDLMLLPALYNMIPICDKTSYNTQMKMFGFRIQPDMV